MDTELLGALLRSCWGSRCSANTERDNVQQYKVIKATDLVIISLGEQRVQLLEEFPAGQKEALHQMRFATSRAITEPALLFF